MTEAVDSEPKHLDGDEASVASQNVGAKSNDLDERKFAEAIRAAHAAEARAEKELSLQDKEMLLKERELAQKADEAKFARLTNPFFVGVVGAVIAALAGIGSQYIIGLNQIKAELTRHTDEMVTEKFKAEALRISEAIKSDDELHTACHLSFLYNLKIVTDENLSAALNLYLRTQKGVDVFVTPSAVNGQGNGGAGFTPICTIQTVSPSSLASNNTQAAPSNSGSKANIEPIPGKLIATVPFETGWLSGGHTQDEACRTAVAINQAKYPGKIVQSAGASEDVRKDFIGHVTYNYHCTVNVFEPAT